MFRNMFNISLLYQIVFQTIFVWYNFTFCLETSTEFLRPITIPLLHTIFYIDSIAKRENLLHISTKCFIKLMEAGKFSYLVRHQNSSTSFDPPAMGFRNQRLCLYQQLFPTERFWILRLNDKYAFSDIRYCWWKLNGLIRVLKVLGNFLHRAFILDYSIPVKIFAHRFA